MLQLRPEDVHFASILEDDFVVEVGEGSLCFWGVGILDKCFPYFCFFEYEYFDDGSVWAEELVEIVVGDDVAELVVDADEENGSFWGVVFVTSHLWTNNK